MLLHIFAADAFFDPSQSGLPTTDLTSNTLATVLTIVFGITGAIAVLIITVAGIQLITSQGNPQSTAKARSTVIYAGVGLVVSILGAGIVRFVITKVT